MTHVELLKTKAGAIVRNKFNGSYFLITGRTQYHFDVVLLTFQSGYHAEPVRTHRSILHAAYERVA